MEHHASVANTRERCTGPWDMESDQIMTTNLLQTEATLWPGFTLIYKDKATSTLMLRPLNGHISIDFHEDIFNVPRFISEHPSRRLAIKEEQLV